MLSLETKSAECCCQDRVNVQVMWQGRRIHRHWMNPPNDLEMEIARNTKRLCQCSLNSFAADDSALAASRTRWYIVLFLRMRENGNAGARTSIKTFPYVAEILLNNPSSTEHRRTGWSVVFIIGPVPSASLAANIRELWSASQKGVEAKVARGEALCRVLDLEGYVDWQRVLGHDVIYLVQ